MRVGDASHRSQPFLVGVRSAVRSYPFCSSPDPSVRPCTPSTPAKMFASGARAPTASPTHTRAAQVKTIGDAFMIVSESPERMLRLAQDLQQRFFARDWDPAIDRVYREKEEEEDSKAHRPLSDAEYRRVCNAFCLCRFWVITECPNTPTAAGSPESPQCSALHPPFPRDGTIGTAALPFRSQWAWNGTGALRLRCPRPRQAAASRRARSRGATTVPYL